MSAGSLHLGVIGTGSMTATVLGALAGAGVAIGRITVLARPGREDAARAAAARWAQGDAALDVFSDVAAFIDRRPAVVAECASQSAARVYVPDLLRAGLNVVLASVGVLADPQARAALTAAGPGRLTVAPGAVGGLDLLSAARLSGLSEVVYTGRKPPSSWPGGGTEHAVIFEGSAQDAALRFPQNANVAAAIALAGIGFEKTRVRLIADPECTRNIHEITFASACARGQFRIEGIPSPDNPKTSLTAGYSVARCVMDAAGVALAPG